VALALCLPVFVWGLLPMLFVMFEAMWFGGTGARAFSELYMAVHPLVQAGVVTDAATGDLAHQGLSALTYSWPNWLPFRATGVLGTTGIVLATMLGHMGVGLAFGALTVFLVRRMNR